MNTDMGETEIRTLLDDARNKGWSDQTLVQRAMDMARVVNVAALKFLRSEERIFLSAMSRLVQDAGERRFVQEMCDGVLTGEGEVAVAELRRLVAQHGGVPTFFSSMGRLRWQWRSDRRYALSVRLKNDKVLSLVTAFLLPGNTGVVLCGRPDEMLRLRQIQNAFHEGIKFRFG